MTPARDKNGDVVANQVSRQCRQHVKSTVRPAVIDRHVPTFDVTDFTKASAKRGHILHPLGG
jgi:hypothetical protein